MAAGAAAAKVVGAAVGKKGVEKLAGSALKNYFAIVEFCKFLLYILCNYKSSLKICNQLNQTNLIF